MTSKKFSCIPLILFLLLLTSVACEKGGRVWDAERSLLSDNDAGVAMQFPAWGAWELIDSTGKDDILFCAVNKTTGTAVMLCGLTKNDSQTLTKEMVGKYVDQLVVQENDANMGYTDAKISSSLYIGEQSFRFRKDLIIPVEESNDTIRLANTGYVFSKRNKDYGFLVTIPAEIIDTYGDDALSEIFDGLKLK